MKSLSRKGFTLVELVIVLAILVLLFGIAFASVSTTRARSRDNQVKSDKQVLILALVRAKEADANGNYPVPAGSAGVCLKPSGTCWRNAYSGNSTTANTVAQYMPGGVIPKPPGATSGQYRYDSYLLYKPASSYGGYPAGSTFLIWPQEKSIGTSECNTTAQQLDTGIWYCYEKLP